MVESYRVYRHIGFNRIRSTFLSVMDTPVMIRIFG